MQKAYQGLLVTALKDKRMKLQRLSEMLHGSNGTAVNPAMGVASPGTSAARGYAFSGSYLRLKYKLFYLGLRIRRIPKLFPGCRLVIFIFL